MAGWHETGKCCLAGCNISTTYSVKLGGGDASARNNGKPDGCLICGGQDYACVSSGGSLTGNPTGTVQDTNNATDSFVSIWASVQVDAQSRVDDDLRLLVNGAALVDFPGADYMSSGCGTTADQCQILSATTKSGQAYVLGGQNQLSFQGNMCFTTLTLVVAVTQTPCRPATSTT